MAHEYQLATMESLLIIALVSLALLMPDGCWGQPV